MILQSERSSSQQAGPAEFCEWFIAHNVMPTVTLKNELESINGNITVHIKIEKLFLNTFCIIILDLQASKVFDCCKQSLKPLLPPPTHPSIYLIFFLILQ